MNENWKYQVAVKEIQTVDEKNSNMVYKRMATVDANTGDVIGLVSPKYRPIQNQTIYDVMQNVSSDLGLKLNSIVVCKNRAATIFKYGFTEKQVAVEGSKETDDVVKFGVEAINIFDGGLPSGGIRFFAERLVCLNGMTLPRTVARIPFRKLEAFSEQHVKNLLADRMQPILNTAHTWNEWAKFTPSRIKVGEFIGSRFGIKISEDLLTRFDGGKDHSLWGLYNLVTAWMTHELKVRNPENTRIRQHELGGIELAFYKQDFK